MESSSFFKVKRIWWCRVLDNLFFMLCADSLWFWFFSSRHSQTICFMTCPSLPLQHDLVPLSPFLLMLQPRWPSFCVSHSPDFSASRSLSCCFLCGKRLFKLLAGVAPSQYSDLGPRSSERPFLNSQSKFPSCPATDPSVTAVSFLLFFKP